MREAAAAEAAQASGEGGSLGFGAEESMFDRLVLLTVEDQEALAKVNAFVASVPWNHVRCSTRK